MRGWQGYPSEKSWFSIHFPWVNHTLYYTGAPECPVVLGHNLHFAILDLSKRENNLLALLAWWKTLSTAGGGVSTVPRTGVCNSNQNILTLSFFPCWDTELCVPCRLGDLSWLWEQGWGGIGAGLWIPECCKEASRAQPALTLLCSIAASLHWAKLCLFSAVWRVPAVQNEMLFLSLPGLPPS